MATTVAARDIGINKVGSEMEGQAGWAKRRSAPVAARRRSNYAAEHYRGICAKKASWVKESATV